MCAIRCATLVAVGAIGVVASNASATIWNAAADFSSSSNPVGAWSYGTRATADGTALSLLTDSFSFTPTVGGWIDTANSVIGTPTIYANSGPDPVSFGTVTVAGNSLAMHPAPTGFGPGGSREFAVVRWTAPVGGIIAVTGSFLAFDIGATDVHLVLNGNSIFSSIRSGGSNVSFSEPSLTVNAGDTLDFVVGNAGAFEFDTTGLDATIVIPAPGAAALMGMGGLVATRRRRA
jgi:hypothetical protein